MDLGAPSSRFVDEQEWQGTLDPAAWLSVPAAIQFQTDHDWPSVRAGCHELLREARRRIEALTGLPPICPDSPGWYLQMASFPLRPGDAAALQRLLYHEYRIEVPIIEWNGRWFVRASIQGYNRAENVEGPAQALVRLLPLVSVSPTTG